jgi:hypothetical protein
MIITLRGEFKGNMPGRAACAAVMAIPGRSLLHSMRGNLSGIRRARIFEAVPGSVVGDKPTYHLTSRSFLG